MTTLPISGPMPTLYHGNGPVAALAGARDLLAECRPPAVQIHSHRPGLISAAVRKLLPGVVLTVGVGVDGIARKVAKGTTSVEAGISAMVTLARAATHEGAVAIVWNAEAGFKARPGTTEKERLSALVRGATARVAADFPGLRQWLTSFDHPAYQSSFPWEDWLHAGSPVEVELPQFYAAPADPKATAGKGAVERREASAAAKRAPLVRAGRIRPNVRTIAYYQAHNVRAADTIAASLKREAVALWAYPTRDDADGRNALRALCELHRRGLWRPDGVRELQRLVGVKVDGAFGPATAKAAGIRWETAPPAR
jgi:hypothetical protein